VCEQIADILEIASVNFSSDSTPEQLTTLYAAFWQSRATKIEPTIRILLVLAIKICAFFYEFLIPCESA